MRWKNMLKYDSIFGYRQHILIEILSLQAWLRKVPNLVRF
jgi:hypothetical protein